MSHRNRKPSTSDWPRFAGPVSVLLAAYLAVAYAMLPLWWTWRVHHRPELRNLTRITHTSAGIPGDPLNVSLVGSEADVQRALQFAGWRAADPLSLRSRLEIAEATVLKQPYEDAPVSNLYWNGRKEDLAFEKPVGNNPRQRHHVRFWISGLSDTDGRPVWLGSATFDDRVGFSHTTGQITHHIAADIDAERDHLFRDLDQTGQVAAFEIVPNYHQQRQGRNGGGDPWRTDGSLYRAVIRRPPDTGDP